jgi:hypothetical protein
MNQYNVWNKWGRLKSVMVGNHYTSDFFNDVKNSKIRSSLQQIADETHEDLENYKNVLKDFGCNVIQPELDPDDTIMNYIDNNGAVKGKQGVPRSPLQPRDAQVVIGNTLYYTDIESKIESVESALNSYNSQDQVKWYSIDNKDHRDLSNRHWSLDQWNTLSGSSWGSYKDYCNDVNYYDNLSDGIRNEVLEYHNKSVANYLIDAPSVTIVGRDLYVDSMDTTFKDFQIEDLKNKIPNIRINKLKHGGHSDGCFHTIKPGAILSILEIQNYENTFPNWDVCYLSDKSWDKARGFMRLKDPTGGKWWLPGAEDNDEFTNFVETWLQDWVGYVEETVFDVNVLVLDEHHVCVSQLDNPIVNKFLKKHKMEPVHVPWRHRYFWDGGLHCITLDLEREGVQEDYFPDRGDQGLSDPGFD